MNQDMKAEILNLKLTLSTYFQRLEYAAIQDDERIGPQEAKAIKRIEKAMNRFAKELDKITT